MNKRCRVCGCIIQQGRFCPDCAGTMAMGILKLLQEEKMERSNKKMIFQLNPERCGRMRYFGASSRSNL